MQEPANIPRDVMRHERAMKQESMVFQFHNMEILQPPPIPPIPFIFMAAADEVAPAMSMVAVPVMAMVAVAIEAISPWPLIVMLVASVYCLKVLLRVQVQADKVLPG